MPMINMIAARRAERKKLEKSIRLLSLSIFGVVVLAASLYAYLGIRVMVMKGDRATIEASLLELKPTVDQIHSLESAQAHLEPKVQLLTRAQQDTGRWRDLMADLSHSLPNKTWLTNVQVARDEKGENSNITLMGMSAKQASVGETMLRVGTNRGINDVQLKYTNMGKVGEEPVVNFELAANMNSPEGGKPK